MDARPTARVWDRETARAAGVGPRRLAGPEFDLITRGAYLSWADSDDLRARVRAYQHVRPDALASHWTALAVLGLPMPPTRRHEPVHLLVGPGSRPLRRAGVVAHRSSVQVRTVRVRALATTGPVRTWCDLARSGATVLELVAVGDALARAHLDAVVALEAAVSSGHGRRGVRTAREALTLLDARAESIMESWLRVVLVLAGVPAPVPQLEIFDPTGRFVARVDLAWPAERLVVEYDGDHHRDRATWVRDLRRREDLERLGWRVVVVTAHDVLRAPGDLVHRVVARLAG